MNIPDKNILTYIKDSLDQNSTRDQINDALLSAGWESSKIEEAFNYLESGDKNTVTEQTEEILLDDIKEGNNHHVVAIVSIIIVAIFVVAGTVFFALHKQTNTISKNISKSKVVLSDINYSMVLFSKLTDYKSKSISFKMANSQLAKKVCVVNHYYHFNNISNDLSDFDTICNPYLGKDTGSYSDSEFFVGLLNTITKDYLNSQRIDHIVMQFYVKDINGEESNRLDFTLKNDR